ncbi:AraC family transcriptional regulator [Desulfobaculum sp.]
MGKLPENTTVQFWRDADLPGVELRYSSYHKEAFRRHTHAAYSVGLVERGSATFALRDAWHSVRGGQLVIIPPNVAHACNPDAASVMVYWMFYIDASFLERGAREMFGSDAVLPQFSHPVVESPALYARWKKACEAIAAECGPLQKQSCLLGAVADVLQLYMRQERGMAARDVGAPAESGSPAVARAQDYIAQRVQQKITLDELAQAANMSRYHLLRLFQAQVGLAPHAYQNQLRVNEGKALLQQDLSISHIAAQLGFTDQSHFSRVFKQFTGATPVQYRRGGRVASGVPVARR